MVTMKDIAMKAGVSKSAVVFTLNERQPKHGNISQATRDKIMEAAKELGYVRNEIARSISIGRSNTIVYIAGQGSRSISLELIVGAAEELQRKGFVFKLFVPGPSLTLADIASQCVAQMAAGVICASVGNKNPETIDFFDSLAKKSIPVVMADSVFALPGCSNVRGDDETGVRLAMNRLLTLGHRRIGFVNYNIPKEYINLRHDFYLKEMREINSMEPALDMQSLHWREPIEKQNEAIAKYLLAIKPTAVFCASDFLAMQLLLTAHRHGIKVPEELSVVGYDNLESASFCIPPLTTVKQPFKEIGARSASLLIDELTHSGKSEVICETLPVELVVRESCARHP